MHRLGKSLAVFYLVLAGAIAVQAPAAAQTDPPPGGVVPPPTSPGHTSRGPIMSPGRAAALSIVPGLGQHQMGDHRKGYLMEAGFVCGAILVATGGSNDDGGSSYTPPAYTPPLAGVGRTMGSRPARLLRASASGHPEGESSGNGDGDGSSTGRTIGIGFMAASVVWSVIDAPLTAKRLAAVSSADPNTPVGAGVLLDVRPNWGGFNASISLRF